MLLFWAVTPCGLVCSYQHFSETYYLLLQCWTIQTTVNLNITNCVLIISYWGNTSKKVQFFFSRANVTGNFAEDHMLESWWSQNILLAILNILQTITAAAIVVRGVDCYVGTDSVYKKLFGQNLEVLHCCHVSLTHS
jgi:hypothetical protein